MKYQNIIGRKEEISTLERLYKSQKSEFVAIYGRRRVGKSFLVSEVYGRKIVFSVVDTFLKAKNDDIEKEKTYESSLFANFPTSRGFKTSGNNIWQLYTS